MAKFEVLCLPPVISWEEIQCGWVSLCSSFLSRRSLRGHSALHIPSNCLFSTNYGPGLFYVFLFKLLCNSLVKWRKHFPVCNIPSFESIWPRAIKVKATASQRAKRRWKFSKKTSELLCSQAATFEWVCLGRRRSTSASLRLPKASRFSPAASKRDFSNYLGVSL